MNTKVNEGKLISGKEALIALANGEEVELNSLTNGGWVDAQQWAVEYFIADHYEFRLKPHTILINGIEVPAPFEPKDDDKFFYLNDGEEVGYIVCTHDWGFDPSELNFGAWRTEEEVQQVIAALRQVFGGSHEH